MSADNTSRAPEHVCLLTRPHEAHDWWYTSSGGGHMMDSYDESEHERDQRQWHCPGINEEDGAVCSECGVPVMYGSRCQDCGQRIVRKEALINRALKAWKSTPVDVQNDPDPDYDRMASVVDDVVWPLVESHDQEVSEAFRSAERLLRDRTKRAESERDVVILGVLRLIGDLDDARVSGENYTYEEIQRRLRLCIDGNDPECDHVYRVFREVSGGTCIKCTECGELLSRDGK